MKRYFPALVFGFALLWVVMSWLSPKPQANAVDLGKLGKRVGTCRLRAHVCRQSNCENQQTGEAKTRECRAHHHQPSVSDAASVVV